MLDFEFAPRQCDQHHESVPCQLDYGHDGQHVGTVNIPGSGLNPLYWGES